MKMSEYQKLSERTMPKWDNNVSLWYWNRMEKSNYALGLNGEAGEVGEIVKKHIHHHHPYTDETEMKLKKEIGDVLHYLAGLCTMYNIQLEECATLNLMKLEERYPNEFNKEDSLMRKDEE